MDTHELIIDLMEGDEFDKKNEIVQMGQAIAPELLDIINTAQNSLLRERAMIVLGEIGLVETAPEIEVVLDDPDPVLRLTAARTLTQLTGSSACPTLVSMLDDTDPGVRSVVLDCLAKVGDEDTLESLEHFKMETTDEFLRTQARATMNDISNRIQ